MLNPSEVIKTVNLACNLLQLSFRTNHVENLDANESDLIFAKEFIFEKLQEFERMQLLLHPQAEGIFNNNDMNRLLKLLRHLERAVEKTLAADIEKRGQMLRMLLTITRHAASDSDRFGTKIGNPPFGSILRPRKNETDICEREEKARRVTNRVK